MKFAYIRNPLAFFLGVCAIAWAIGFARYFDHWVFFSAFPNVLDSIGLSLVGSYLLYEALGSRQANSRDWNTESRQILSVFDDIDALED